MFYEESAHDNAFYNHYPARSLFVEREWHMFIQHARRCMAEQLADPNVAVGVKDDIMEALTLDRMIPRPDNVGPGM